MQEPIIFPNTQLSENLLSQSLNGHKIRNVANKVKHLDSINDQIVLEILRQFCPTTLQEPRNESLVLYEETLQVQYIYLRSKLFGPVVSFNFSPDKEGIKCPKAKE